MKNIFSKKINLVRDWKIIISVFALCLSGISIFAWQIYLSNHIGGGYFKIDVTSDNTLNQNIDKDKLQKAIYILESRQADYLKIKAGQKKLIDPSL